MLPPSPMSTLGMGTIKIQPTPKPNKLPITLSTNSQAGACGTREFRLVSHIQLGSEYYIGSEQKEAISIKQQKI